MRDGNKILRLLRKARKETIANIATDAGIEYKSLSKIETGATKQPSRETLQKILNVLDEISPLKADDMQIIYDFYGYKKTNPLPNEKEIKWACDYWKKIFSDIPYPAYLIDFGQRLLDWNKFAPRLLGMKYGDPRLQAFQGITIFDLTFTLANGLVGIKNREGYLKNLIHIIKSEFQPYQDELWYPGLIRQVGEKYPEFQKIWEELPEFVTSPTSGNIITLHVSSDDVLKFQLIATNFIDDQRFRVVQWLPIDEKTIKVCSLWQQDEMST